MFAILICLVLLYIDHWQFCVVCINGRGQVCCGECYVVSNECDELTSCRVQPIVVHCCEVMYSGRFDFSGEVGFLNCDDVCMCVVSKQFELLGFVFESVDVDLQYDEISLTFTAGSVCWCGVCGPMVDTVPFILQEYWRRLFYDRMPFLVSTICH